MKAQKHGRGSSYLDLSFSERVVVLVLLVPPGRVTTYGDLARAAHGGAMAAQSVTAVLGRMEKQIKLPIPYHRVVYADGRVWFSDGSKSERRKLYRDEGIELHTRGVIVDFEEKRFDFKTVTAAQLKRQIKQLRAMVG